MTAPSQRRGIGVMINNFDHEYQRALLRGVDRAAAELDLDVWYFSGGLLGTGLPEDELRNVIYDRIDPRLIQGLVVSSSVLSDAVDLGGLLEARRGRWGGLPVVSINAPFRGVPSVLTDNRSSVRELVDHLVGRHGRSRFAFMGGPAANIDSIQRREAFLAALARHRLEPVGLLNGFFNREQGTLAMREFLDRGVAFDALVAANDVMAFACIDELAARGVGVPAEVSVVGFDDLPDAALFEVPLSTVSQPAAEQAWQAVRLLADAMDGKPVPTVSYRPTRTVLRQSCGCASPEALNVMDADYRFEIDGSSPALADSIAAMDRAFDELVAGRLPDMAFLSRLQRELRLYFDRESVGVGQGRHWDNWLTGKLHRPDMLRWIRRHGQALHQTRVMIREAAEGRQAAYRLRQLAETRENQIVAGALASSFGMPRLVAQLKELLPRLGVLSCHIALFGDAADRHARLVFSMQGGKALDLPEGGLRFEAQAVLPPVVLDGLPRHSLVLETLHHDRELLGLVAFGMGGRPEILSDALSFQIRGAVKAALLVDELSDKDRRLRRALKGERSRAQELARANEQLRQNQEQLIFAEKMAVLGSLVAGMSHEINTPLGVALTGVSFLESQVELLREQLAAPGGAAAALQTLADIGEACRVSVRNMQKASELIQGFRQISSDLRDDTVRPFKLREYLEEVLTGLLPAFRSQNVQVNLQCPDDLAIVSSPGALSQIVSKLAMNSVLHGFAGRSGNQVRIAVERTGGELAIRYADNGRGLADKDRAHLFEPFYFNLRRGTGNGLGTYTVFNLVRQRLGGSIEVDPAHVQGLAYVIRFPVESA